MKAMAGKVQTRPAPGRWSRRGFLAAAGVGLSVLPHVLAAGQRPISEGVIDTHTHFYDPTRKEGVPWPPKEEKLLYRRVMPDDLKPLAKPVGVIGTVVVEASVWVEDNQWLLDLADREPLILGIVGRLEPGAEDFARHLARFARHPKFKGIRVGTWGGLPALDQPRVLDDYHRLADANLTLDTNGGAERLPQVARLARAVPGLRIVVNHVANVRVDGSAPPAEWLQGIRELAGLPQVFCKLSGLVEGTGRQPAPTDPGHYRPVFDEVWRVFGPDRLIYGSNWPVSERFTSYGAVQGLAQALLADKEATARQACLAGNAQRAYRLPAA